MHKHSRKTLGSLHSEDEVISSESHEGGGRVVGHAGHRTAHRNLPL